MIIVNGELKQGCEGMSVADYIENNGYNIAFIAVEYNGDILPKTQYQSVFLKENDKLEVVSFVGGG